MMSDPTFVEPEQLRALIQRGEEVVIVDVRSADEYAAHHIDGAINIPADQLNTLANTIARDATVVTVCNFGGQRSCNAAEQLRAMGYESATALRGGTKAWREPPGKCRA